MLKFARRITTVLLLMTSVMYGCSDNTTSPASRARSIIEQTREQHGSDILERAVVEFDFRGDHYTVRHDGGIFSYERIYTDSMGRRVREVLTNDSLHQVIDGERRQLSANEQLSVETTVNSVVYFALLPYYLNDPAVQPRYLGTSTIQGAPYHEVEVTFTREGGGRDWQDRFVYWIHRDRLTMDYFAYYYHTGGGGSRFREAVNVRSIEGVRFADYINYTVPEDTLGVSSVEQYDKLFEAGSLEKVSEVRLHNIEVRPLE